MSQIQHALVDLATSFAENVLQAVRGASLEDLLEDTPMGRAAPRAARSNGHVKTNGHTAAPRAAKAKTTSNGRLARRSQEDIDALVGQVVGLLKLKENRDGLRAEAIKTALGLQAKEMPRILGSGVEQKVLKTKGQKRATTYSLTGKAPSKASSKPSKGVSRKTPTKAAKRSSAKKPAKKSAKKK
jgi:hypothetical protein